MRSAYRLLRVATLAVTLSLTTLSANASGNREVDEALNHLMTADRSVGPAGRNNHFAVFNHASAGGATANQGDHRHNQRTQRNYQNPFLGSGATTAQGTKLSKDKVLSSSTTHLDNLGSYAPVTAAKSVTKAAHSSSLKRCALYVRKALQSAGYKITPQPSAYMYNNGELKKAGFTAVSARNYRPQVGDVIVFNRTKTNPHGHIQIYNGKIWVSDFKQPDMMIYGDNHAGFTIWRDKRYLQLASLQ